MKHHELIIDSFAGGGGASLGIQRALGRSPDVAINHDADAIEMHAANHPETRHFPEDVWKVNPRAVTRGRKVGLLWLSPDCKHFSRAKGSKPVNKTIRSLAWIAVKWAAECKPRVIILENVREFEEWGPLLPRQVCQACGWKGTEGQALLARHGRRKCPRCESVRLRVTEEFVPDPARKGLTFRRFTGRLRNLGYRIETRTLNAADFGAPTHRRRLFLVARRDGLPIEWPEPTHGDPRKIGRGDRSLFGTALKPWRTAAECIDWSIPCPSIFDRKKPLAEKTLKRIALGIKRYVLDNPRPFIVPVTHQGERRNHPIDEPMPTVTGANRGEHAVITPLLSQYHHSKGDESRCQSPAAPINTLDTQPRYGLVAPVFVRGCQTNGNGKYANSTEEPLTTITSKAEHMVVAPLLTKAHSHGFDKEAGPTIPGDRPAWTVTAKDGSALVSAFIARHFGDRGQRPGSEATEPLPTTTARGTQTQVVTAHLTQLRGSNAGKGDITEPAPTVTAQGQHAGLVAANLIRMNHGEKQWAGVDEPASTVTTQANKAALVYSFLMKYFGTGGQWQAADEPLHTATAKGRFGLVTVTVDGEPYVIVDIGMRMLTPRELARCQGFPDDYVLTGTKTSQVARIGNSVCPDVARAIVEANFAGVPV